jgi:hypothetical protein
MFDIQQIEAEKYFASKEKVNIQTGELEKITDFEQVKQILDTVVYWGFVDDIGDVQFSSNGDVLCFIQFRNGKKFTSNIGDAYYFIAYYPTEDILLLEGGHTSDVSFNLVTGEETRDVGNPEYIIFSPLRQYRLNGYFGGQECSAYFIQENIDGNFEKIIQLDSWEEKSEFEKKTGIWLCRIIDAFWENRTVLNFITVVPSESGREEIKLYYQLILK